MLLRCTVIVLRMHCEDVDKLYQPVDYGWQAVWLERMHLHALIPALLNTTSRRPNSLMARWTMLSMSFSLPTSQVTAVAFGASFAISAMSATVFSAAGPLMSAQTTWAPSLANRIEVSRPIPLQADRGGTSDRSENAQRGSKAAAEQHTIRHQ